MWFCVGLSSWGIFKLKREESKGERGNWKWRMCRKREFESTEKIYRLGGDNGNEWGNGPNLWIMIGDYHVKIVVCVTFKMVISILLYHLLK